MEITWVLDSFFCILDLFPYSAVHVMKNLAFRRCRSCSSSETTAAPGSISRCFVFAGHLAWQLARGRSAEALEEEKGGGESQLQEAAGPLTSKVSSVLGTSSACLRGQVKSQRRQRIV